MPEKRIEEIRARRANTQATWDAWLVELENSDRETAYRDAQNAHIVEGDIDWLLKRVEELEAALGLIAAGTLTAKGAAFCADHALEGAGDWED